MATRVDERSAPEPDGRRRHRRGVTEIPGLYFLGLTWQHTRGSALLGWVKDDAEFIAAQAGALADTRATSEADIATDDLPTAAGVTQGV